MNNKKNKIEKKIVNYHSILLIFIFKNFYKFYRYFTKAEPKLLVLLGISVVDGVEAIYIFFKKVVFLIKNIIISFFF